MEKILLLAGLGVATVQDLRWKKVWLPLPWGITVLLLMKGYFDGRNGVSMLMCCLFFILFLGWHIECPVGRLVWETLFCSE